MLLIDAVVLVTMFYLSSGWISTCRQSAKRQMWLNCGEQIFTHGLPLQWVLLHRLVEQTIGWLASALCSVAPWLVFWSGHRLRQIFVCSLHGSVRCEHGCMYLYVHTYTYTHNYVHVQFYYRRTVANVLLIAKRACRHTISDHASYCAFAPLFPHPPPPIFLVVLIAYLLSPIYGVLVNVCVHLQNYLFWQRKDYPRSSLENQKKAMTTKTIPSPRVAITMFWRNFSR